MGPTPGGIKKKKKVTALGRENNGRKKRPCREKNQKCETGRESGFTGAVGLKVLGKEEDTKEQREGTEARLPRKRAA